MGLIIINNIVEKKENPKEALKGTDVETIKNKTKDLTEVSMKLGEAIYKSQQEQPKPETEPTTETSKDNVVDADFEEVKEKEKSK